MLRGDASGGYSWRSRQFSREEVNRLPTEVVASLAFASEVATVVLTPPVSACRSATAGKGLDMSTVVTLLMGVKTIDASSDVLSS